MKPLCAKSSYVPAHRLTSWFPVGFEPRTPRALSYPRFFVCNPLSMPGGGHTIVLRGDCVSRSKPGLQVPGLGTQFNRRPVGHRCRDNRTREGYVGGGSRRRAGSPGSNEHSRFPPEEARLVPAGVAVDVSRSNVAVRDNDTTAVDGDMLNVFAQRVGDKPRWILGLCWVFMADAVFSFTPWYWWRCAIANHVRSEQRRIQWCCLGTDRSRGHCVYCCVVRGDTSPPSTTVSAMSFWWCTRCNR